MTNNNKEVPSINEFIARVEKRGGRFPPGTSNEKKRAVVLKVLDDLERDGLISHRYAMLVKEDETRRAVRRMFIDHIN